MDGNLHAGHRKRMIDRVLNNSDSLSDHEKLEVLLFSVVARKDTNALAHSLINAFGDLAGVFSATPEQLLAVKGVGKNIATQICVFGKILDTIVPEYTDEREEVWNTFDRNKKNLMPFFPDLNDEKFMVFFLDNKYKRVSQMEFKTQSNFAVMVDVPELVQALAVIKPKYLVIAHNHPSGMAEPSDADDFTTKKLNILCDIHDVQLADHIIITAKGFYSYHVDGRMDKVKKTSNVSAVLREVDKTESKL